MVSRETVFTNNYEIWKNIWLSFRKFLGSIVFRTVRIDVSHETLFERKNRKKIGSIRFAYEWIRKRVFWICFMWNNSSLSRCSVSCKTKQDSLVVKVFFEMNVSHETGKDFSKKLIAFVFHMKQSGCKGKGEKVFHVKHMLKCL